MITYCCNNKGKLTLLVWMNFRTNWKVILVLLIRRIFLQVLFYIRNKSSWITNILYIIQSKSIGYTKICFITRHNLFLIYTHHWSSLIVISKWIQDSSLFLEAVHNSLHRRKHSIRNFTTGNSYVNWMASKINTNTNIISRIHTLKKSW